MPSYKIETAKSGLPTLIASGEKDIRLHSGYDPEKEASRAVVSFDPGRASIILVSGTALGYHIAELKKAFPDRDIIALEHDKEALDLAAAQCPENIKGIRVITSRNEVIELFETLDMTSFRGVARFNHRPSYLLYREFYDTVADEFKQQVSSRVSDILTRIEFEEKWITNIFSNIHHAAASTPVQSLFGEFKNIPGIIVSAGPSLRKNLDLLKDMKERALILCVDTAAKVMARKDITPHIIMTLDAQKHSVRHFLGMKESEAVLCADVVSYPPILRSWSGNSLLSTTAKYFTDETGTTSRESTPGMAWFEEFMPPLGDIQSGGSVATSAFDMLLNCGCDPIILVGQDLAYTGREIHCSGTHHNDDWLPLTNRFKNLDTINQQVIRKRSITRLEAFGGEGKEVITDFVLNLYRGWFEDSAHRVPVEVINATEGGLRIGNTREMTLEEVKNGFPPLKKSPGAILATSLGSPPDAAGNLKEGLTRGLEGLLAASTHLNEQTIAPGMLEDFLSQKGIASLVFPFLRQSTFYITRKGLDAEKAEELLNRDLKKAVAKLIPLTEQCLARLA